jgi:hypothetical protein
MIPRVINSLMIAIGVALIASARSATVRTLGSVTVFGGPSGAIRRIVERAPVVGPPTIGARRRLRRRRYSPSSVLLPPVLYVLIFLTMHSSSESET